MYREVINGVRYIKASNSTALTKIHKKLLKYISSYNDDSPDERTWVLQLYLKSLGFSEIMINWAIEDAVRFQNGAFSI